MVKKVIPAAPNVFSRPDFGDFDTNTPDIENVSAGILDVVDYSSYSVFFRGIRAGNGIAVNLMPVNEQYPELGKVVVLSSSGELAGYINQVENVGTGNINLVSNIPVADNTLNIRTIQAGNGIDLEVNNDTITISSIPDGDERPAIWIVGSGIPSTGIGNLGDMYLNTSNGDVYNLTVSGWTLVYNIGGGGSESSGTSWYSGTNDPTSLIGNNGDFYYQTSKNKIWQKTSGTWTVLSIIEGSKWFNGQGDPTDPTVETILASANEGDYYLNSLTGDVWELQSTWTLVANIKGSTGNAATASTSINQTNNQGSIVASTIQPGVRIMDIIVQVTEPFDSEASFYVGTPGDLTSIVPPNSNLVDLTTVGTYEISLNYGNTTELPQDIQYTIDNPDKTGSATITMSYL